MAISFAAAAAAIAALLLLQFAAVAAASGGVENTELVICRENCRRSWPLDERRKQLCKHECAEGHDAATADAGGGGEEWGLMKKGAEEICEQWCWDSAPGGVGEMECLKDCFEVYGVIRSRQ